MAEAADETAVTNDTSTAGAEHGDKIVVVRSASSAELVADPKSEPGVIAGSRPTAGVSDAPALGDARHEDGHVKECIAVILGVVIAVRQMHMVCPSSIRGRNAVCILSIAWSCNRATADCLAVVVNGIDHFDSYVRVHFVAAS